MKGIPEEFDLINFDYSWFNTNSNSTSDLLESFEKDPISTLVKNFSMEQKETSDFEKIISQWETNDTFYIFPAKTTFKLLKDGNETEITLNEPTIIWETTLLQYLNWQKTSASASIEVKWKYYQISFEDFRKQFEKLSSQEQKIIKIYFKELENKRKGKTEVVVK